MKGADATRRTDLLAMLVRGVALPCGGICDPACTQNRSTKPCGLAATSVLFALTHGGLPDAVLCCDGLATFHLTKRAFTRPEPMTTAPARPPDKLRWLGPERASGGPDWSRGHCTRASGPPSQAHRRGRLGSGPRGGSPHVRRPVRDPHAWPHPDLPGARCRIPHRSEDQARLRPGAADMRARS
jgi:hypothetical protein